MAKLTYKRIMRLIEKEKKAHKKYRDQAKEAAHAARDDDENKPQSYNIHWSNCIITKGAIFSNMPVPDVRRRYRPTADDDPRAALKAKEDKELARLIERAIAFQADVNDYETPADAVVMSLVQEACGVPRVTYDVETRLQGDTDEERAELAALAEEFEEDPPEEIVSQSVGLDYWPSRHFHWEPGRTSWSKVRWTAYESFVQKGDVKRDYGVEIKTGKDEDAAKREAEEYADEVQLYEFLYKPTRMVYVVSPSHPKIIDAYEDKLNLSGFFHSPRPAFSNLKSDEIIPKPDYQFVEGQIVELNRVTQRIKSIAAQIKAVGYYDASIKNLSDLTSEEDGTLKPVAGLKESAQGSADGGIRYLPLDVLITTFQGLIVQRKEIKDEIFETLGISDIVRGVSAASETASAANLKGRWVGVRLQDKIDDVARLWRDVYRMVAEIICEHFDPIQLELMTGIKVTQGMMETMRTDIGRNFSVDIETDSTIAKTDHEERQQTMELVETIRGYLENTVPGVMNNALTPDFVTETLMFIVSKHKNGKQLEDAVSELGEYLKQRKFEQVQQMQQQLQQMGAQMQQMQQQAGQAVQQRDKAIQGLQQQLGKVNERKEAREDAKVKSEIADKQTDNQVDAAEAGASNKLKEAQTAEIYHGIMQPQVTPIRPPI